MASIFSRIVAGEIPCHKIAENEEFFAFLDINPVAVGHTLVIPKQETDYIFDIDDPMLGRSCTTGRNSVQADRFGRYGLGSASCPYSSDTDHQGV